MLIPKTFGIKWLRILYNLGSSKKPFQFSFQSVVAFNRISCLVFVSNQLSAEISHHKSVHITEKRMDSSNNMTLTTTVLIDLVASSSDDASSSTDSAASWLANEGNKQIDPKNVTEVNTIIAETEDESIVKRQYSFTCMATESHGQQIYGCQFYQFLQDGQPLILATVGSNKVSIYECTKAQDNEKGGLKILQSYSDIDPEEAFYTCAWTMDENYNPLLAAGGEKGCFRIFSPSIQKCVKTIEAHLSSINHLLFHPKDRNLLFTASKDSSIRLWNIKTEAWVAFFGGLRGHREQVLTLDIDESGSRLISGGMDHAIKVWNLETPEMKKSVQQSYYWNKTARFPTLGQHFPICSTVEIHTSYVDSLKWFGGGIISKSCDSTLKCWKFGKYHETLEEVSSKNDYTTYSSVIHEFGFDSDRVWFVKFEMDFNRTCFALGNTLGKIYLYELNVDNSRKIQPVILEHPRCNSTIRQTAFSKDGSVLIAVCDNSTIWRWDIRQKEK